MKQVERRLSLAALALAILSLLAGIALIVDASAQQVARIPPPRDGGHRLVDGVGSR